MTEPGIRELYCPDCGRRVLLVDGSDAERRRLCRDCARKDQAFWTETFHDDGGH